MPHFAARKHQADYVAEMGTDKDYEFLFIGTNPSGAKIDRCRVEAIRKV